MSLRHSTLRREVHRSQSKQVHYHYRENEKIINTLYQKHTTMKTRVRHRILYKSCHKCATKMYTRHVEKKHLNVMPRQNAPDTCDVQGRKNEEGGGRGQTNMTNNDRKKVWGAYTTSRAQVPSLLFRSRESYRFSGLTYSCMKVLDISPLPLNEQQRTRLVFPHFAAARQQQPLNGSESERALWGCGVGQMY